MSERPRIAGELVTRLSVGTFSGPPAMAMMLAPSSLPISTAVRPTPPAAPVTISHSPGLSLPRWVRAKCEVPAEGDPAGRGFPSHRPHHHRHHDQAVDRARGVAVG